MKLMKKVLPVILAGTMVFGTVATGYAAEDPWSIANATKADMTITVDGEAIKLTKYTDNYLDLDVAKDYLTQAQLDNAKVDVYVPEGADENSPILYMVNNGGWFQNSYPGQLAVSYADGDTLSTANDTGRKERGAEALANDYVVVVAGLRSRQVLPPKPPVPQQDADGNWLHSPVTAADAKAVVRFIKHNDDVLPGNADMIFVSGTSGGGALSSILGASGNSSDYIEELTKIGACMEETDDILGVVAYCPITDLGHSDNSYEFTYAKARDLLVKAGYDAADPDFLGTINATSRDLSPDLAYAYTSYINDELDLTVDGKALTAYFDTANLAVSGTLVDTMKAQIIECLNDTLENKFDGKKADFEAELKAECLDNLEKPAAPGPNDIWGYKVVKTYDAAMTEDDVYFGWITYANDGSIADIDLDGFMYYVAVGQVLKPAPAFTNAGLDEFAGLDVKNENNLFGHKTDSIGYLSKIVYDLSDSDIKADYDDWNDYWTTNGATIKKQMRMVDSISYLIDDEGDDAGQSAPYWYARHGIVDRDTGFANQTLYSVALDNDDSIEKVDFAYAWGKGHEGDYGIAETQAFMNSARDAYLAENTPDDDNTDDGTTDDGTTDDGNTDDGATSDGDEDDDKKSPTTADSFGFLAVAVVAAAGLAFSARRRVVR